LRADDGSAAPPLKFLFGTLPGDYQSTPPNFPTQPQFTNWSHVKPFALERASQFRPGPPPALASDAYSDAFDEIGERLAVVFSSNRTARSPKRAVRSAPRNAPLRTGPARLRSAIEESVRRGD
jgi:hypothetical protein